VERLPRIGHERDQGTTIDSTLRGIRRRDAELTGHRSEIPVPRDISPAPLRLPLWALAFSSGMESLPERAGGGTRGLKSRETRESNLTRTGIGSRDFSRVVPGRPARVSTPDDASRIANAAPRGFNPASLRLPFKVAASFDARLAPYPIKRLTPTTTAMSRRPPSLLLPPLAETSLRLASLQPLSEEETSYPTAALPLIKPEPLVSRLMPSRRPASAAAWPERTVTGLAPAPRPARMQRARIALDWVAGASPWQSEPVIERAYAAVRALESQGIRVELVRGREVVAQRYDASQGQPAGGFSLFGPAGPIALDHFEVLDQALLVAQRPGYLQVLVAPTAAPGPSRASSARQGGLVGAWAGARSLDPSLAFALPSIVDDASVAAPASAAPVVERSDGDGSRLASSARRTMGSARPRLTRAADASVAAPAAGAAGRLVRPRTEREPLPRPLAATIVKAASAIGTSWRIPGKRSSIVSSQRTEFVDAPRDRGAIGRAGAPGVNETRLDLPLPGFLSQREREITDSGLSATGRPGAPLSPPPALPGAERAGVTWQAPVRGAKLLSPARGEAGREVPRAPVSGYLPLSGKGRLDARPGGGASARAAPALRAIARGPLAIQRMRAGAVEDSPEPPPATIGASGPNGLTARSWWRLPSRDVSIAPLSATIPDAAWSPVASDLARPGPVGQTTTMEQRVTGTTRPLPRASSGTVGSTDSHATRRSARPIGWATGASPEGAVRAIGREWASGTAGLPTILIVDVAEAPPAPSAMPLASPPATGRSAVGLAVTHASSRWTGAPVTSAPPSAVAASLPPLTFARDAAPEPLPLRRQDVARADSNRPAATAVQTMPSTTTTSSSPPSQPPEPPDLDLLARQAYALIKQKLAVERERLGMLHRFDTW